MVAARPARTTSENAWTALRYFNLYRLVLTGLFLVLIFTGNLPPPLASFDRTLFAAVGITYFLLAVIAQVFVEQRWLPRGAQVFGQMLLDIAAITVMMYASGGITSGFGMLLIVSIAGGGLLTGGRTAILFAAIASLAVLAEELYSWAFYYFPAANYTHAGFLGATFFGTAFVAYVLGQRVRESEALASQRAIDLANLAQLNEHIIQRMQAGIVALDGSGQVRTLNASAARLLGIEDDVTGRAIADVAPELVAPMQSWLRGEHGMPRSFRRVPTGAEVNAYFTGLGQGSGQGTLVFLEDAAVVRQRAQQLKLASLGRLTASIAHEVRNPLGAISHASQLLSESGERGGEDLRLTRIIRDQSERVNAIIETILQLGRREASVPQQFDLLPWLRAFMAELTEYHGLVPGDIRIDNGASALPVRMDANQLRQVLWNLCENALRYGRAAPRVAFRAGVSAATERPFLDVRDSGPGVAAELREHIFEPFFTTDSKGTGLGLYVATELCESNQASLILYENSASGCVFRINFAHPDKQQLTA
ncbi:MAG: PAS domain-containing protein [Gammaproteobacteria bacterium]|nr:PAS domain-containing protein [Gammaproteobacteria bacterium]